MGRRMVFLSDFFHNFGQNDNDADAIKNFDGYISIFGVLYSSSFYFEYVYKLTKTSFAVEQHLISDTSLYRRKISLV